MESSELGRATPASAGQPAHHMEDTDKVAGWLLFAGTMVMIAGILNVMYGIAGIGNANWLEANTAYVFSNLETWGWIGITSAGLNSIVMLMFIPAYPFGALAVFAIDALVIYGLAAYGGRRLQSF